MHIWHTPRFQLILPQHWIYRAGGGGNSQKQTSLFKQSLITPNLVAKSSWCHTLCYNDTANNFYPHSLHVCNSCFINSETITAARGEKLVFRVLKVLFLELGCQRDFFNQIISISSFRAASQDPRIRTPTLFSQWTFWEANSFQVTFSVRRLASWGSCPCHKLA